MARYYSVPLTDPRLLDYTDELLDLEFELLKQEHPDKFGGENYADPNYEAWVAKSQAEDRKFIMSTHEQYRSEVDIDKLNEIKKRAGLPVDDLPNAAKKLDIDNPDEWEDVEVDEIPSDDNE